jgi:type 1 glutamine amidotransferase
MVARRSDDDRDQPVVWAHRYGAGRVVYDGFGHDATSINDADHAALLRRAVDWVTEGVR